MQIPARLQSGKGLFLVAVWCVVTNGILLCCAAIADLATGGDFLARWIPGGGASLTESWVGAPPISRLLAIAVGGLTGMSLARARFGWMATGVIGLIVLFPWLRRGMAFLFADDGMALQPFLPVLFWALGLVVGCGLAIGWLRKHGAGGDELDEPTTEPNTWLIGAVLVVAVGLGTGESCSKWAELVTWNGYVDRLRAQIAEESCSADAIWRVAFVASHAPEPVAARVAEGCEGLEPDRGRRARQEPAELRPVRRAPARNTVAAAVEPLSALGQEEKDRRLAVVYQAMFGGTVKRSPGGFARVATAIGSVRQTGVPTVVLDAGSLTNIPMNLPGDSLQETGLRANAVLDAARVIGFDAICPSRGDLALGVDWLQMQASMRDLPYTSANLRDASGALVFPSHKLLQVGSWRVGVLCVTAPNPACGGCEVSDGAEAAREALDELAALRPDLTICLGDLYGNKGVRDTVLVQSVEGIDLFLGSSSSSSRPLERVADTLLARTRSKGVRLELLTITSVLGARGFHAPEAASEAAKQRKRKARHLENLEERLRTQESGDSAYVQRQIDATRAELAAMDAVDHSPDGHHLVEMTHLSVSRDEEDSEIAAILDLAGP